MTDSSRELSFTRLLDAPRAAIWRRRTDSDLLPIWFGPPPFKVSRATMDVRAGGAAPIAMGGPNGEEMPKRGIDLEGVPHGKTGVHEGWGIATDRPEALARTPKA